MGNGPVPAFQNEIKLDASQVNSGRFPLARIPAGDLGKVLTGQGPGNNPIFTFGAGGIPSNPPGGYSGVNNIYFDETESELIVITI